MFICVYESVSMCVYVYVSECVYESVSMCVHVWVCVCVCECGISGIS